MAKQHIFFLALGKKVKELRRAGCLSQEDMITFGFSARHWQQIEAGRPITLTTLLRICEVFKTTVSAITVGLDAGIYDPPEEGTTPHGRSRKAAL